MSSWWARVDCVGIGDLAGRVSGGGCGVSGRAGGGNAVAQGGDFGSQQDRLVTGGFQGAVQMGDMGRPVLGSGVGGFGPTPRGL